VYYPAAFHPQGSGDFGNALLVKGTIEADHKLILPHTSRLRHMLREAVAADVVVDGIRLRAYSVHLETPFQISASDRRDQARAIVQDAARYPGPVVIAGDFNSRDTVGDVFGGAGFQWVTRDAGHTISFFSWDHVFVRGLPLKAPPRRGIVSTTTAPATTCRSGRRKPQGRWRRWYHESESSGRTAGPRWRRGSRRQRGPEDEGEGRPRGRHPAAEDGPSRKFTASWFTT
jgi:hypothetical protein